MFSRNYLGAVEADARISDRSMRVDVAWELGADAAGRAVVEHSLCFNRVWIDTDIGTVDVCRRFLHHNLDRFPYVTVLEQRIHPLEARCTRTR